MTQSTNNPPIARVRLGGIQASIWKNMSREGRAYYTFTEERSYLDDEGKWQRTDSYTLSDALVKAKLANMVDTKIRQLIAADRAADKVESDLDDTV